MFVGEQDDRQVNIGIHCRRDLVTPKNLFILFFCQQQTHHHGIGSGMVNFGE